MNSFYLAVVALARLCEREDAPQNQDYTVRKEVKNTAREEAEAAVETARRETEHIAGEAAEKAANEC